MPILRSMLAGSDVARLAGPRSHARGLATTTATASIWSALTRTESAGTERRRQRLGVDVHGEGERRQHRVDPDRLAVGEHGAHVVAAFVPSVTHPTNAATTTPGVPLVDDARRASWPG